MEFTCGDHSLHLSPSVLSQDFTILEKREGAREVALQISDESREKYCSRKGVSGGLMELQYQGFEFCPVEHPLEPLDEDRPVKCPLPASSLINDGKVPEADGFRKRPELMPALAREAMVRVRAAPVRAARKRQHALSGGEQGKGPLARVAPLPPLQSHNITVFQMLQEFDKYES